MRRIASLLVLLPLLGARVGAQLPRSVQVTCSDFPELSGTFTLRPERENDSELYYKPTVFGDETNPETFNFLYRSGNPGRWILVRGLTAMRERQGDLLSEQDNLRGGPFGLVWLKAVGGRWVRDETIAVVASALEAEPPPLPPQQDPTNGERDGRAAQAPADARGAAWQS
eukprot:CAMPEP_0172619478 /NCGR_PEP_ID=MMETSP1068-20121228/93705_1 /TAXON_ID=35684 /ORGANISM="Pseudopedinella elastica, Strain CCMP716" /LENGTH=169 /DNA_ID=CAMNT_0013426247 /DNA_START=62 /DNA_END=568 /DNA_ORIENTATION=-